MTGTQRRLSFLAAALFLVNCGPTPEADGPPPAVLVESPRNLVLIVIDTLRADHLGAYGYPHPTSPVLDDLAARGVRFSQFIANSSWTRPSMATLLTGLYGRSTGIFEERWDGLADSFETLPERLSANGFVTLGVTANPSINAYFGFDQGFDEYISSNVIFEHMMDVAQKGEVVLQGDTSLLGADGVTDRALDLMARHADELGSRPFYLQLLYIDPHPPQTASKAIRAVIRESGSNTVHYDAGIRFADREIGRLLAELSSRGLLENTLVVVTSDHGQGLFDHPGVPYAGRHGGTLYDSVLHVPLIFWHADMAEGMVEDSLVGMIDLMPTLADLFDVAIPAGELPGHSFADRVLGRGAMPDLPDWVVAETDFRVFRKRAVRTPTHRLILNHGSRAYQRSGAFEGRTLAPFDRKALTAYPVAELHPIGIREHPFENNEIDRNAPIASELRAILDDWEATTPSRKPEGRDPRDAITLGDGKVISESQIADPAAPPDASTIEQLRALGYLENAGDPDASP